MRAFLIGLCLLILSANWAQAYSGPVFYAVENDSVYYHNSLGMGVKIEGADPATFKAVPNDTPQTYGRFEIYATDKNHVYYYTEILPGISPQGFGLVHGTDLVKNNEHVYYEENGRHVILEDMDPATISVLSPQLMRDERFVYYRKASNRRPAKIEGLQSSSLEVLWGTPYLKDAERVFYLPKAEANNYLPVAKADPASFMILDSYFGKDKNNYFRRTEKIEESDYMR